MVSYRLGKGAKDDAGLGELFLERRGYGDTVEYRIDRDAGEYCPFVQGDAQLFVSLQEFRIDFIQALGSILVGLGRRLV